MVGTQRDSSWGDTKVAGTWGHGTWVMGAQRESALGLVRGDRDTVLRTKLW